jgi:hypothetical protein
MVKPNWDTEELIENWTLLPQELELTKKKVGGNQIGFALLLKHFQLFAYFPEDKSSISQVVISYIANTEQIDVLLSTEETESDESVSQSDRKIKMSDFAFLKTDPGAIGLGSFLTEIEKLKRQLRSACAEVVNATFEIRLPHIWGEGTTTCASDSKHFGAWEQNLITQYHLRYGGRGVMIYWVRFVG